ncbi:hypothetical protein D6C86_03344 [Aureobasidium pullulans]|uniref:Uncharacterized protein n=1 Tax=Aureobasidium pullulans TaxID=5580 RepID=A0A4S9S1Q5_AURPU|nr:hypothetical protein D6D28_00121 [Aureobasidium pullulans]THW18092.1 hypothetical protein D6D24_03549 [Aureobasidium pullulans]THW24922.1 hypothetical protein D6D23_04817 [Aureobasidium pullulans]THW35978.1 hypothetical protein D6D25_05138 [Aureobasidium pullulans]THW88990.1 hypothetical protein D6D15_05558 [Aureobasidium pullulans]
MSAPRAYQFIALRRLAAGGSRRQLHMTGPATFPSPLLTAERPVSNLPRDIAGLRAECKRRKLDFSGSMHDLMGRLSADDLTHSRAFTTAVNASKRPSTEQKDEVKAVRHFNTSRTLKAVNDSSTIDFAYFPDFDPDNAESFTLRVPLLPSNFSPARVGAHAPEADDAIVIRPQISTMANDKIISNFSEVSDNNAMPIDFHAMADRVAAATQKAVKAPLAEQTSIVKQLWKGLVEDFQGVHAKPIAA